MAKYLVIGGGGMVASYLIELLLDRGHQVGATIRWNEDLSNIKEIKDKIDLFEVDLSDYISVLKAIEEYKPDGISILGAESYVSSSFIKPQATFNANTFGWLNIFEAVKYLKEKEDYNPVLHCCSSSEVYGLVDENLIPINENCRFTPANIYAVSKAGCDLLARMYYTNYGLKTITTRMFTHTSSRRKMLSAEVNFAKQIAEMEKDFATNPSVEMNIALGQRYILKHGNLNSIRTWAHVEDACEAYYLILTQPKRFGEAYNIGGIDSKEIGEMLDFMISLSPLKDKIIKQLDKSLLRKHDVTLQLPDVSKFKKDYPEWKPKWKFEEIIKDVLEGQRKNA